MSISEDLDNISDDNSDKSGFLNIVKQCSTCGGKGFGSKLKLPCPICNGTGKVETEVSMSVMELFLRRQVDKFRRQGLIPPKDDEENQ